MHGRGRGRAPKHPVWVHIGCPVLPVQRHIVVAVRSARSFSHIDGNALRRSPTVPIVGYYDQCIAVSAHTQARSVRVLDSLESHTTIHGDLKQSRIRPLQRVGNGVPISIGRPGIDRLHPAQTNLDNNL